MSSTDFTDIFDFLDCSTTCAHCGMHYDPSVFSFACPCCKKALNPRVLRDSTIDGSRIDYATAEGVDIDADDTKSDPVSKQSAPRARSKPVLTTTSGAGEDANVVLCEFESLLVADGYKVGSNRDGTAIKYCRYMKMLFDHDIFVCRDDFFRPGARNRAHSFYMSMAKSKANEAGGRVSRKKLYKNFANGYDKFVLLGTFHATEDLGCESEGDILAELSVDELLESLGPHLF